MYIVELVKERENYFSINGIIKLIEDSMFNYFFKHRVDPNDYGNEDKWKLPEVKPIIYKGNPSKPPAVATKTTIKFILNLRTNSNVETIQEILDKKKSPNFFRVFPLKATSSSLFKTQITKINEEL